MRDNFHDIQYKRAARTPTLVLWIMFLVAFAGGAVLMIAPPEIPQPKLATANADPAWSRSVQARSSRALLRSPRSDGAPSSQLGSAHR